MTKASEKNAPVRTMAVFGGGRMATAVSAILSQGGAKIRLWEIDDKRRAAIKKALPHAHVADSLEDALQGAGTVFFGVPATVFPEVARAYGPHARGDHIVLHAARGVSDKFTLAHEMIREETCVKQIGALAGPLYFDEDALKAAMAGKKPSKKNKPRPLFVALGSRYPDVHRRVAELSAGTLVRLHSSNDLVGTEVAAAFALITALVVGMADALGLDETAQGVIAARGLSEATALGIALGGELSTFTGLAGVGDLIPRRVSSTERHYDVARRLVEGESLSDIMPTLGGKVEGVQTAYAANKKALDLGLALPMVAACVAALNDGACAADEVDALLSLDLHMGSEILRARGMGAGR